MPISVGSYLNAVYGNNYAFDVFTTGFEVESYCRYYGNNSSGSRHISASLSGGSFVEIVGKSYAAKHDELSTFSLHLKDNYGAILIQSEEIINAFNPTVPKLGDSKILVTWFENEIEDYASFGSDYTLNAAIYDADLNFIQSFNDLFQGVRWSIFNINVLDTERALIQLS